MNHHDETPPPRGHQPKEKTITFLDDLLSGRECKRPDRGLLQIIIGLLHYLPNPRTHTRTQTTHSSNKGVKQISTTREKWMDEKNCIIYNSPPASANSRIFLSLFARERESHIARLQPLCVAQFRFCGADEPLFRALPIHYMRSRNSISGHNLPLCLIIARTGRRRLLECVTQFSLLASFDRIERDAFC